MVSTNEDSGAIVVVFTTSILFVTMPIILDKCENWKNGLAASCGESGEKRPINLFHNQKWHTIGICELLLF